MPIQDIQNEIESPIFEAQLGIVSTPRSFDQALYKNPSFRRLLSALSSEEDAAALSNRLAQLIDHPSDPNYCHPFDLQIGVYLRALDLRAPERAYENASRATTKPNLWWGRAMSMRVLAEPNRQAATTTAEIRVAQPVLGRLRLVSWNEPPREITFRGAKKPARRSTSSKDMSSDATYRYPSGGIVIERVSRAA
jgi:hypothetical protein